MDLPEEKELVLVTIKKILPYGAFCEMTEYNGIEAFLHISEVAARWIKNIHEFISEGERHVAKVYRIDREKNQIDISLKRVSEEEKQRKLLSTRQEKRAIKLLEVVVAQSKQKIQIAGLTKALETHYGDLYSAFQEALDTGALPPELELEEDIKKIIIDVAIKNINKPIVHVDRIISLSCYDEEGIEKIKKILTRKEKDIEVLYLGAPNYKLTLTAPNYKDGEKQLSRILEDIKSLAEKSKCDLSIGKE